MNDHKDNGCILISKMYNNNAGAYSNQGENIVHEAINLLCADNGNHYIYIVPRGTVDEKKDVDTVLLVRKASLPYTVEVIAKAIGLNTQDSDGNEFYSGNEKTNQEQWAKKIKYGDVSLYDYMKSNVGINKAKDTWQVYTTYRADEVCKVKDSIHIYITNNKNYKKKNYKDIKNSSNDNVIYLYVDPDNKRILNQSQKLYICKGSDKSLYTQINGIINDESVWDEPIKKTLADYEDSESYTDNSSGFVEIMGQEYNELAYSNMLAFIFAKYRPEFMDFCKKHFDVELQDDYVVQREYEHIDILIKDKINAIVIENKIHSGINGVNGIESQLNKYYNVITNIDGKEEYKRFKDKKKNFFILVPNYKMHMIEQMMTGLDKADQYKMILYSQVYEFYDDYYKKMSINIDDVYIKEFLKAIKRHTREVDNQVEYQMISRMLKKRREKRR